MSYAVGNNRAFVSEVAPSISRDVNCCIVYPNKEGGGTQFDHKKHRRPNSLLQAGTLPNHSRPLTFPLQRFKGFDQHNKGFDQHNREKFAQRKNASIPKEIIVTIKREQTLHRQRKVNSTLSMVVALFGLILAILKKELELLLDTKPQDIMPLIIMATITISSIILTALLIWYHILAMQIKVIEKGLINWKFAISWKVVLQISAEIILANIHPYSLNTEINNEIMEEEGEGTEKLNNLIGIDKVFTILMFTRLYLVMRMIIVHHRLIDGALTGAFNHLHAMKINYSFGFKVLLNDHPWKMLVSMILLVLLLGSWSMRACEARKGDIYLVTDLLDQFWLVAITYLTVGFALLWFPII